VTTGTIGRRAFLRLAAAAGLPAIVPLHRAVARTAPAAVALRVGVVLPHADPAARGTALGTREAAQAARLFRSEYAVYELPADTAAAAAAAAEDLIAKRAVHAVIGGGTPAAADAVQRLTERHGVLFLNAGCAPESLAEPCGALTFHVMPGDAMRTDAVASVPDAPPDARALAWHPSLERFGAGQVNDRFTAAYGRPMTERAWAGWMAMKVLFDAAQRAGTSEAPHIAAHLTSARALFDGHKGLQLSFRPASHQLRQPLYVVAGNDVLAQVPAARAPAGMTHAQWLDTIGLSGGEPCSD
jgi:ABC-type branched-subunit amino acid transport system substrate-binding protein